MKREFIIFISVLMILFSYLSIMAENVDIRLRDGTILTIPVEQYDTFIEMNKSYKYEKEFINALHFFSATVSDTKQKQKILAL